MCSVQFDFGFCASGSSAAAAAQSKTAGKQSFGRSARAMRIFSDARSRSVSAECLKKPYERASPPNLLSVD